MSVRYQFVKKMAKAVLKRSGITTPPVDLKKITDAHGIVYEEVGDFPEKVDALIIEDDTRTFAAVNAKQHIHRQRFSLAHELGHYFLHRSDRDEPVATIDSPPEDDWGEGTKDPCESEADLFAGELLVPIELLKASAARQIPEISRLFIVSEQVAAIVVAKNLKSLF